jgi:hypothetical protein
MRIKKELSTECKNCNVVFDLEHPKQPGRALCAECYIEEGIKSRKEKAKYDKEHRFGLNRMEKYKDYKMSVRQPFWTAINKEIKKLKTREEYLPFISKQMDRILADKQLMDYINDTNIIEITK